MNHVEDSVLIIDEPNTVIEDADLSAYTEIRIRAARVTIRGCNIKGKS